MPLSTPLAQADDMKASTQPRPEAFSPTDSIRLPISAHRSQPWRIHQIAPDFKLLDVWALPTPGGPDFPRLVRQVAEGDTSKSLPPAARALFTIRWKLGKLLGWDAPGSEWALGCRHWGSGCRRHGFPTDRSAVREPAVQPCLSHRQRMGCRAGQPDCARSAAPELGARSCRWLPGPDGRAGEAKRPARQCLPDSDHAIPTLDHLSIADQRNWTTLASGSTSAALTIGLMSRTVHDGEVVNPAASQLIGHHFDP